MADVITGNTQTAATKQAAIAALAQKELKQAAFLSQYFTDVSQFAVKGVKSISFPKLSSFTVGERASGVKGEAVALTSTVDTLALDIPAYLQWVIDSNDAVQTTLQWDLESVSRAASAHGRYLDQKLIDAALANGQELTSAVGDVSRDKILEMREFLKKNNAVMNDVALFVAPDQMTALLKVTEFTQAQVFGMAVIPSGLIGRCYGIPVIETNSLTAGQYFMAEKSGLAYGFQRSPAIDEQKDIDYGAAAVKKVMDSLYGVKALQIGQANAGATKSALIVKYNDGV
jgi:hypothetical protein